MNTRQGEITFLHFAGYGCLNAVAASAVRHGFGQKVSRLVLKILNIFLPLFVHRAGLFALLRSTMTLPTFHNARHAECLSALPSALSKR